MVAHGDDLGAVFPDADVDRYDLVWIHLPHHMAYRPPVRGAWSGCGRVGRRGSGPVRDYGYMASFPELGAYAPGFAPVLATSAAYLILGVLGHGTMRLV